MAKRESVVVKDVYLYYANLNRPKLKRLKQEVDGKPFANKEYAAVALVPHAELKRLKKKYPTIKSVKNALSNGISKEVFKERFKCEPPTEDGYSDGDGEYCVLNINKDAAYKSGDPTPKPEVLGFKSLGNQSKNGFDINNGTVISNGSKVNLGLSARTYKEPQTGAEGQTFDLWRVQVIDLIPMKRDEPTFEDEGDVIQNEEYSSEGEAEQKFEDEFEDAGEVVEEETVDEDFDDEF